MKILMASPYFFPRLGGLENYVRFMAKGLTEAGHEVVVVCGDTAVNEPVRDYMDGHAVWRLPVGRVVSNTPVNPAWLVMLRRIIRAERPDVINAHTPVPFMVDIVTWAAGRTPVVVTYHAATLFKPGNLAMGLVIRAYLAAQWLTLSRAKQIIAVSPFVREALTRWQSKTSVVPNAVTGVASARTNMGRGLIFVNNLQPAHSWKGLDLILDALALAKRDGVDVNLTVVGDGGDRLRYEARVRDLGLSGNVYFTGALYDAERDAQIAKASALVVYSTTANDAFPTVMLEAWSQGVAVLVAAIGPMPSLIDDGRTGVLVEANNAEALARVIVTQMTDSEKLKRLGEAGRQLVEREYTWPRQVERTEQILEAVV